MNTIFLAGPHGHFRAHDGRVDDSTLTLFSQYTNRGWRGIHLGPLSHSGDPSSIAVRSEEDLDALESLCVSLRAEQSDLLIGAALHDTSWEEDRWARLVQVLDWVSVSLSCLPTLVALIDTAPPRHLCLEFPVSVEATPEELETQRMILGRVSHLLDRIYFFHAPGEPSHRVAGSERASAKLVRVAKLLCEGLDVEVMISGRVKHGEDARRVMEMMPGAWVGIGRGGWALPEVLELEARGELGVYCTGCMACEAAQAWPKRCSLRLSETLLAQLRDAPPERLQIVGASYGAMTLALEAARAGTPHVELFTLGEAPGGLMRLRGRVPQQAECAEAALTRYEQCVAHAHITIDREVYDTQALIEELGSREAVRVLAKRGGDAAGNEVFPLHRPPSSRHEAIDLLERGSAPPDPHPNTLWLVHGDTLLAAEVALFLRMQWRRVCWVGEKLAGDTLPVWSTVYAERLAKRGVELMTPEQFEAREFDAGAVCEVDARGVPQRACEAPLREAFPTMRVLDEAYEPMRQAEDIKAFNFQFLAFTISQSNS